MPEGHTLPVFPDYDESLLPPSVVAVNMSFVDITPDNGAVEICDGSHRISDALEKVNNGELPFNPLYMKVGDVLVRDVRCVHRGTPNTTDIPRPMAVLGVDRANHQHIEDRSQARIDAGFYESLSDSEKRFYRLLPRG